MVEGDVSPWPIHHRIPALLSLLTILVHAMDPLLTSSIICEALLHPFPSRSTLTYGAEVPCVTDAPVTLRKPKSSNGVYPGSFLVIVTYWHCRKEEKDVSWVHKPLCRIVIACIASSGNAM